MFSADVLNAAKLHAKAEYPRESCGVVVAGFYEPLANAHPDPENHFRLSPEDALDIQAYSDTQALIHSHTNFANFPSKDDMECQLQTGIPWGIVHVPNGIPVEIFFWGDGVPILELLKRQFKWGVADCYSLGRDYYRQELGIVLPEVPRELGCFDDGESLFEDAFLDFGFVEIDQPEKAGDGVIFRMGAPVPNHCGVMVSETHMIHQPLNGVSRRTNLAQWKSKICPVYRAFRHRSLM